MFTVLSVLPPRTVKQGEVILDPMDKEVTYKAYAGPGGINLVINTNPGGFSEDTLAARFRIHLSHFAQVKFERERLVAMPILNPVPAYISASQRYKS